MIQSRGLYIYSGERQHRNRETQRFGAVFHGLDTAKSPVDIKVSTWVFSFLTNCHQLSDDLDGSKFEGNREIT